MTSTTASMPAPLPSELSTATTPPPPDDSPEPQTWTESRSEKKLVPRRKSRPDQVDPRPLPPVDEWLEAQAAGGCMYYGFYAGNEDLQKMPILNAFPEQLGHRDPSGCTFLYPALMFLRKHFRRRDICVASGYLSQRQRAKDLNPEIEDDVGKPVLVLGLFPLEEEAYLDRMTQAEVDELAELMGRKLTWWRILWSQAPWKITG